MWVLRAAVESDLPFLARLREQTMAAHLASAGIQLGEDEQLARIRYRYDCADIVVVDGCDAGLLKVVRGLQVWEILQIQISPAFQGRGLGRRLIEQLVADAKRLGVCVELSVLKGNPALGLYERLGFRVIADEPPEYRMRFGSHRP